MIPIPMIDPQRMKDIGKSEICVLQSTLQLINEQDRNVASCVHMREIMFDTCDNILLQVTKVPPDVRLVDILP